MMKLNKTKTIKIGASALAICLSVGMVSTMTPLSADTLKADPTKVSKTEQAVDNAYPQIKTSSKAGSKDKTETTYTVMDADGNVKESVVTEQLTNKNKLDSISDYSTLKNIENTSGHEKFAQNGNNLSWEAKGNGIKYKGTPTTGLPVNVKITYFLDGEKMSAKEIAGKSGNVSIHFDYQVNQSDYVNGQLIKHPYTMASGLILKNDKFSDISVSSGKAVDDGSKTIVLGVAFPGMNENLGISKSEMDIPDHVVINAHTDDFELDGTYSIAMSGIFNDLNSNLGGFKGKAAELENALNQMGTAADKLEKGSSELKAGADQLVSGTEKLKEGSSQAISGANALNTGLQQLTANSQGLRNGAKQLELKTFDTATTELQKELDDKSVVLTPATYTQVINGISSGAAAKAETVLRGELGKAGVTDAATQNVILSVAYTNLMSDGKSEASQAEITKYVQDAGATAKMAQTASGFITKYQEAAAKALTALGMDVSTAEGQQAVMITAVEMGLTGGSVDMATLQAQQSKATALLTAAKKYQVASEGAADNVKKLAAIAVGKDAPEKLKALKEQLDSLEMFIAGINQYTAGVDAAAAGSSKLVTGLEQLNDGINQLNDGTSKLDQGASELASGMAKFNQEAIQKFVSKLSKTQLSKITSRLEATVDASKNEVFVGGKDDNMSGESRLIFKTGAVEKTSHKSNK